MSRIILYGISIIIFVGVCIAMWLSWAQVADAEMSSHGSFAIVLLVVFGGIVTAGLMLLMFYSSRNGYDTDAHRAQGLEDSGEADEADEAKTPSEPTKS